MTPRLSVIVASYNSPATLELGLEALERQVDTARDEVIVADCSAQDPRTGFRLQFPKFRFLHFEKRLTIPLLRAQGLQVARGGIVAFTEGRVVPAPGWMAALLAAHQQYPDAAAIGGPIGLESGSVFDAAVFFCEYGRHMPPIADREDNDLSGANVSYKRWALDTCADLVAEAAWEPFWHRRFQQKGYRLRRCAGAVVSYRNSLSALQSMRQRFHYGRWFAAERVRSLPARLAYAVACPVVPFLLTWRVGRSVFLRRHCRRLFLRALPWILMLQSIWALGEFCGYLVGKGDSDRQIF